MQLTDLQAKIVLNFAHHLLYDERTVEVENHIFTDELLTSEYSEGQFMNLLLSLSAEEWIDWGYQKRIPGAPLIYRGFDAYDPNLGRYTGMQVWSVGLTDSGVDWLIQNGHLPAEFADALRPNVHDREEIRTSAAFLQWRDEEHVDPTIGL